MKKVLLLFVALLTAGFALAEPETVSLRILATSDLHGKFMPWDYALNEESLSGSMTQLATAVNAYRTENTLLVDAGDTIQDNAADIFVHDEGLHPMVAAINAIGYDVWSVGNHEFNYGMDVVKKTVADVRAKVLCGNVYDESSAPLADGYALFDVGGVRVAVIGMVTPNITRCDADNLRDCTVIDPLDKTRAIIDGLDGQYDVLMGVFHMGVDDEFGVPDSGVADILEACPEFDVMVSSHEHRLIEGETIGGALVVQNKNQAQTMSVIDVALERQDEGWQVTDKASQSVNIADYAPDPQITELLEPWHLRALADAETVIGRLEGGPLAPESAEGGAPAALVQDTALIDLINAAQLHYTDAAVSAAALNTLEANLYPGEIHKCDASLIYKYTNTLYVLRMNGAQLKRYMEWSANFYNQVQPGDDAVTFNPDIPNYNYYMFSGVNYEINIANPPGNRIEHLTWPDGTPVADDDVFDLAVNNYCANTQLLTPGEIYADGDTPELVASEVRSDIGGIRELIRDYIVNVKNGVLTPECDDNWRITW